MITVVKACQREVNWGRVRKNMDKRSMDHPVQNQDDIPDPSDESDGSQDSEEA
jgi:hypothetical protein